MKRIFALLAVLAFIGIPCTDSVCATCRGWSVVRNTEHKQPTPDSTFNYIDGYDCYYVDKNHGDNFEDKVLYLTFDAGYENGNVSRILDVLKEENVPGAFFVLSHLIKSHTVLVRRMVEEGHTVCNHTCRHKDMTKCTSDEEFMSELRGLENIYRESVGSEMPKYYRPPEGKINEDNLKILQKNGYKTIMWSFAYADWDNDNQPSPAKAKEKIMQYTHNGAVILLHPTSKTNAEILGDCIKNGKRRGIDLERLTNLRNKRRMAGIIVLSLLFFTLSPLSFASSPVSGDGDDEKLVALTFDDGPHPRYTDKILDILKENGVKATFFVIGCNVEYYPKPFLRAIAEGHEIGNHTYSHPHLSKLSPEEVRAEIEHCDSVLREVGGVTANCFRPPEGFAAPCVKTAAGEAGLLPILWTLDTKDWAGNSTERIINVIRGASQNREIILFHDYVSCENHTVEALKQAIPILKEKGYRFCTVSELCE